MPFTFTLGEVLDYRSRIEDVRRREMQTIQQEVEKVVSLIEQAINHRQGYYTEWRQRTEAGLSAAFQEIYTNYLNRLDLLIEKSREHLAQLQKELERRRVILAQAVRERQVLDELKKQEYQTYRQNEIKQERKEMDDISIRQYLDTQREIFAEASEGTRP